MSWTRRFLVLVAFALMLAGVALMVTQKEELYLGLSVAGFALVLAAVPGLPREPVGDEVLAEPAAPRPAPGEPPTGLEHAPSGQGAPRRAEAQELEPPPREEPTPADAEEPAPADAEPVAPAGTEPAAEPAGGGGEPAAAATAPASPPVQPAEPLKRPAAARLGRPSPREPARRLLIGGIAAVAVLVLWRWLRR